MTTPLNYSHFIGIGQGYFLEFFGPFRPIPGLMLKSKTLLFGILF